MSVKQDLIDGELWEAEQRRKMGSKKFDAWIRSQEIYKYTDFNDNIYELEEIMEKAGYDLSVTYTPRAKYIKTHFGSGRNDYFFWIVRYKKITACFIVADDKNLVQKFINAVENTMGKKCFFDTVGEITSYNKTLKKQEAEKEKLARKALEEQKAAEEERRKLEEAMQEKIFPTSFVDENLLKQALSNSDLSVTQKDKDFMFKLPDCNITIFKEKDDNYSLKVVGKANLENVYKYVQRIETEYNKIIQYNICENIKSKVEKSPTMQLEQEEVLEDNSVLLTIRV